MASFTSLSTAAIGQSFTKITTNQSSQSSSSDSRINSPIHNTLTLTTSAVDNSKPATAMMEQLTAPLDGWDLFDKVDPIPSYQGLAQPAAQQQQQQQIQRQQQQQQQQQQEQQHEQSRQTSFPTSDIFLSHSAVTVSPSQLSLDLSSSDPAKTSPAPSGFSLRSQSPASLFEQPSLYMSESTSSDVWSPLFDAQTSQDLFSLYASSDLSAEPAIIPETGNDPFKGVSIEQQLFAALSTSYDLLPPYELSDSDTPSSKSVTPDTTLSLSPERKPVTPDLTPALSNPLPRTSIATLATPETTSMIHPAPQQPYKVTKSPASSTCPSPRRESDASSVHSSGGFSCTSATATQDGSDSPADIAIPRVSRRARKEPLPEIQFDPDDPVAAKRARNTLAARKSRARRQKQEEWSTKRIRELEETVKELQEQAAYWKSKAAEAGIAV
ncbi:hypothetical protein KEM54_003543 [Ascosphaera aggregata]|nr:hypothetical protein KEM54_003543 [Ascosphaera aggregata]